MYDIIVVTPIKNNWRYCYGDCVMSPHPKLFVPLKQNGNRLRMETSRVAMVTTPTYHNVSNIHPNLTMWNDYSRNPCANGFLITPGAEGVIQMEAPCINPIYYEKFLLYNHPSEI